MWATQGQACFARCYSSGTWNCTSRLFTELVPSKYLVVNKYTWNKAIQALYYLLEAFEILWIPNWILCLSFLTHCFLCQKLYFPHFIHQVSAQASLPWWLKLRSRASIKWIHSIFPILCHHSTLCLKGYMCISSTILSSKRAGRHLACTPWTQ